VVLVSDLSGLSVLHKLIGYSERHQFIYSAGGVVPRILVFARNYDVVNGVHVENILPVKATFRLCQY
jgi:hypothetical protein